jgi:hypothetical protein
MGALSIAINLFTILLVSIVFYITFLAFNRRETRDETWLQVFKRLWSSENEINKTLSSNEPVYGDLGSFVGYDWEKVPLIKRKDADNQDSLMDFMKDAQGRVNYAGTKDWS